MHKLTLSVDEKVVGGQALRAQHGTSARGWSRGILTSCRVGPAAEEDPRFCACCGSGQGCFFRGISAPSAEEVPVKRLLLDLNIVLDVVLDRARGRQRGAPVGCPGKGRVGVSSPLTGLRPSSIWCLVLRSGICRRATDGILRTFAVAPVDEKCFGVLCPSAGPTLKTLPVHRQRRCAAVMPS